MVLLDWCNTIWKGEKMGNKNDCLKQWGCFCEGPCFIMHFYSPWVVEGGRSKTLKAKRWSILMLKKFHLQSAQWRKIGPKLVAWFSNARISYVNVRASKSNKTSDHKFAKYCLLIMLRIWCQTTWSLIYSLPSSVFPLYYCK